MVPSYKQGNKMTKLNNEICELNSHELDQVSGGNLTWIAQREQEVYGRAYSMARAEAAIQKDVNSMRYELTHFL
jgi:bacteriocin-like protein